MSPEKPSKQGQPHMRVEEPHVGGGSYNTVPDKDALDLETPATPADTVDEILKTADAIPERDQDHPDSDLDINPFDTPQEDKDAIESMIENTPDVSPMPSEVEEPGKKGFLASLGFGGFSSIFSKTKEKVGKIDDSMGDVEMPTTQELGQGISDVSTKIGNKLSQTRENASRVMSEDLANAKDTAQKIGNKASGINEKVYQSMVKNIERSENLGKKMSSGAKIAGGISLELLKNSPKIAKEMFKKISGFKVRDAWQDYKAAKELGKENTDDLALILESRNSFIESDSLSPEYVDNKIAFEEKLKDLKAFSNTLNKDNPEHAEVRKKIAQVLIENRTKKEEIKQGIEATFTKQVATEKKALAKEAVDSGLLIAGIVGSITTGGLVGVLAAAGRLTNLTAHDTIDAHKNGDESKSITQNVADGISNTFKDAFGKDKTTEERIKSISSIGRYGALLATTFFGLSADGAIDSFDSAVGSAKESILGEGDEAAEQMSEETGTNLNDKGPVYADEEILDKNQTEMSREDTEVREDEKSVSTNEETHKSEDIKQETIETEPTVEPAVEMTVSKGSGGIGAIEELKGKLLEKYPVPSEAYPDMESRPELVRELLDPNKTSAQLAEDLGFFNPDAPNESFMLLENDQLLFDEKTGLDFRTTEKVLDEKTGLINLTEKTTNLLSEDGMVKINNESRMFDADGAGGQTPTKEVPTARVDAEQVIREAATTAQTVAAEVSERAADISVAPEVISSANVNETVSQEATTQATKETTTAEAKSELQETPAVETVSQEAAPSYAPEPQPEQVPVVEQSTPAETTTTPNTPEQINLASEPSLFDKYDNIPKDMRSFARMLDNTNGGFNNIDWSRLPEDFGRIMVGEGGTGITVGQQELPVVHSYNDGTHTISLFKDGFYGKPTPFSSESGMKDILYKALLATRETLE